MPSLRALAALLLFLGVAPPLCAQLVDDVKVGYAQMHISKARLSEAEVEVDFTRHFVDLVVGRGPATLGLTYQAAVKGPDDALPPALARTEHGLMLTAGYDVVLSPRWRVESFARVGVSGNTHPEQALYATDTDLRVNAVTFWPDGWGFAGGHAFYPSLYAGAIANRYGRVQGIAGAGLWWNGIGAYATGFRAVNGVDDPLATLSAGGDDARTLFATLRNAGVSASVTFERGPVLVGARRNWALHNGGEDVVVWASYRYTIRRGEVLP